MGGKFNGADVLIENDLRDIGIIFHSKLKAMKFMEEILHNNRIQDANISEETYD